MMPWITRNPETLLESWIPKTEPYTDLYYPITALWLLAVYHFPKLRTILVLAAATYAATVAGYHWLVPIALNRAQDYVDQVFSDPATCEAAQGYSPMLWPLLAVSALLATKMRAALWLVVPLIVAYYAPLTRHICDHLQPRGHRVVWNTYWNWWLATLTLAVCRTAYSIWSIATASLRTKQFLKVIQDN